MNTLNRKIAPIFKKIENINFLSPEKLILKNKIPLYYINAGDKDVVKVEFIFNAGLWYSNKPLVASFTNQMLNEGTKNRPSQKIAEAFDFYGTITSFNIGNDFAYVSMLCLNKYLNQSLEIIIDIFKNSIFPESEFDLIIKNKKQNFELESNKVKTIARRKFGESLYGINHPYSNIHVFSDYDNLSINDLKCFYDSNYSSKNCTIIASGKVSSDVIKAIENVIGKENWGSNNPLKKFNYESKSDIKKHHFEKKENSVQSAIRIGKILFNKTDIDYYGFSVLNTILGGYFGSRLMSNIREDKGYTYGIGSVVFSMKNSGYFAIVTEAGASVCKKAVDEIYFEIERLKTELVPEKELTLVKNYMLGEMLRAFDGPFAQADSIKDMIEFNHDKNYYINFLQNINSINSKEIQELAIKYLEKDSLYEIIAGEII